MSRKDNNPNNPIRPFNFVVWIPRIICVIVAIVVVVGLFHVYSNGKEAFDSTLPAERMRLSKQVSAQGDAQLSKYKFVKSIWARDEKPESRENRKKFLLWESLPGLNAEISKDIKTLQCPNKKGKNWSDNDDRTKKANAWCSLIGSTSQAIDAKNEKNQIRQIVNKNDDIKGKEYEGNKELFELPPYDFWTGVQKFPDNRISENGEYTLSIYPSVQEGMFEFMSKNNMVGAVFAYRPSNGDIYCMASTPGWTEREMKNVPKSYEKIPWKGNKEFYKATVFERQELPKAGAQMNKNFGFFTPGSTMKPLSLFVFKDQEKYLFDGKNELPLKSQKIVVGEKENKREGKKGDVKDVNWGKGDSYYLKEDLDSNNEPKLDAKGNKPKAIHCQAHHDGKPQSASDGLGNSCNSFFAKLAEKLDLEKARGILEDMDFYKTGKKINTIDKILYTKSAFPLEDTTKHNFTTVMNFIGESNLIVSPIDMAVLTALFGKLSSDNSSKVYFPRIWLPVDEKARKEGSPELLLTEKNPVENEHIAKLSDFVSTRKESIAEVGRIWKKAFDEHYRVNNQTWPANRHLDSGTKLKTWSQWIDMAKTGTVGSKPDETSPRYECKKYTYNEKTGKYVCKREACHERATCDYNTRTQRTLSLYSEELDLAAYIVIENYNGVSAGNSETRLDSTSLKLTQLVADALGKKLDSEKQKIENEQWERFNGTYGQEKAATGQKPKKPAKPKTPMKKAPQKGKSKKR